MTKYNVTLTGKFSTEEKVVEAAEESEAIRLARLESKIEDVKFVVCQEVTNIKEAPAAVEDQSSAPKLGAPKKKVAKKKIARKSKKKA